MSLDELQRYDGSEVQEILRLAQVARRRLDYFTREDMIRAAAELDVPESAVIEAEQLVRERQSEIDDRAEYRRGQARELTKGVCIGIPVLSIIVFGHAFHYFGNVFSLGTSILKPLGGLLFSRSTQHELDFQTWRNKRYRKVMNIIEPSATSAPKTVWNTDIGYMIHHGVPKSVAAAESSRRKDGFASEVSAAGEPMSEPDLAERRLDLRA